MLIFHKSLACAQIDKTIEVPVKIKDRPSETVLWKEGMPLLSVILRLVQIH